MDQSSVGLSGGFQEGTLVHPSSPKTFSFSPSIFPPTPLFPFHMLPLPSGSQTVPFPKCSAEAGQEGGWRTSEPPLNRTFMVRVYLNVQV